MDKITGSNFNTVHGVPPYEKNFVYEKTKEVNLNPITWGAKYEKLATRAHHESKKEKNIGM